MDALEAMEIAFDEFREHPPENVRLVEIHGCSVFPEYMEGTCHTVCYPERRILQRVILDNAKTVEEYKECLRGAVEKFNQLLGTADVLEERHG